MGSLLTLWAIWKCLEIFVWLNENFGTKEVLLSHISCVRLCATPSLGFKNSQEQSRTLEWVATFLLQCIKVKSESEVVQSCLTLRDPMDCSLLGSSVHGIFQARVLEWGVIAFSEEGI